MKILVTGANGQVGACFQRLAPLYPDWRFIFAGSGDLDITEKQAVDFFLAANPGVAWLINCAAYTAVDKAESEPEKARNINVTGAKILAEACAKRGILLVHFSSDYVYHTQQNTPFKEHDPVKPKGVYARTKLAGERAATRAYPEGTMVIRTSWVYASVGQNFVKTMLRLGKERSELRVVADQIGTPTYAPDLALAVLKIIEKVAAGTLDRVSISGVWNYSNEGVASWYDFAQAIFDLSNVDCHVVPIETQDYPTPAQRPPFSVLNKTKIKNFFGIEIPHWRESLEKCLVALNE